MIDMWLKFKNSQPCPNAPDKTIAEVLEERKRQNIDINRFDDLMLATEAKTIQRNGIRFLGCDYFDERLYGFKNKVLIKYSLFDLTKIKVFTSKGEYLCTAERVTETHPMAKLLGNVKDFEDYKQKIKKQKKLRRKTINSIKELLSKDENDFITSKVLQVANSDDLFLNGIYSPFKPCLITVQNLNADSKRVFSTKKLPFFRNNAEKYEYLIKSDPNNSWIMDFKQTKEYELIYGSNT